MYLQCRAAYVARRRNAEKKAASVAMTRPKEWHIETRPKQQYRRHCSMCGASHPSSEMRRRMCDGKYRWYCQTCLNGNKFASTEVSTKRRNCCNSCGISTDADTMRRSPDYKWYCAECFAAIYGTPQAEKKLIRRACKICGERYDRKLMHRHTGSAAMYCDSCWTGRMYKK